MLLGAPGLTPRSKDATRGCCLVTISLLLLLVRHLLLLAWHLLLLAMFATIKSGGKRVRPKICILQMKSNRGRDILRRMKFTVTPFPTYYMSHLQTRTTHPTRSKNATRGSWSY